MRVLKNLKKISFYFLSFMFLINYPSFANDSNLFNSDKTSINWLNYDEKDNKDKDYLLIYFSANWCNLCRDLENNTYKDKDVIEEITRDFTPIKVDLSKVSNSSYYISKYNISKLPFIIFFNKKSNTLLKNKITGFVEPEYFLKELKEVKINEKRI